jgi:D-aminoacyl-tRNA deacylase
MILTVASNKDPASVNIKKQILKNYRFKETTKFEEETIYEAEINSKHVKLVTLNRESIHAQNLASQFPDVKLVVFISRHSSVSGKPTLSVHTPGNLGEAEYGGTSREVSVSPANAMREALKTMMKLKQERHLDYEISYEGTHHGPSLNVPTMFVELGSSAEQWKDLDAADIVAHATMEAISTFGSLSAKTVLGIGGPHYNSKFTHLALENDIAFGHMIPKYAVSQTDEAMLKQCIERTFEKVKSIVLDWKGIKGEDKQKLVDNIEKTDLQTEKV